MLLKPITWTRSQVNRIRSRHAPRFGCGCHVSLVELLGGHLEGCANAVKASRGEFDHLPQHQVDGIPMPVAGPMSPDLSCRWCDTSDGDVQRIARFWPRLNFHATATRNQLGWAWQVDRIVPVPGEGTGVYMFHKVDEGPARDAEEVFRQVAEAIHHALLIERLRAELAKA